jgi:4-amino-4-deoxy-L-arabinose transferase-like glycosyltransferase
MNPLETEEAAPTEPTREASRGKPGGAFWLGLFLVGLLLALPGNDQRRPLDAHEVFVARTATEMARGERWLEPYFDGEVRFQKPPLQYWLVNALRKLSRSGAELSVSEEESRLPSILAGAALVCVTAALAFAHQRSRQVAAAAGLLFATTQGFLVWSHSAQPEMTYAGFIALALLGFVRSATSRERSLAWSLLGWSSCALAVLTKGPVLPAFLLLGLVCSFLFARTPGRILSVLRPGWGLPAFLVLTAPYFVLVARRDPAALAIWESQIFDRAGGASGAWLRPLQLYYVPQLLGLAAPWCALLALALVTPWHRRGEARTSALMLWFAAVVPLVCLSFSAGRKGYYALPALAPLCALMASEGAWLWERWKTSPRRVHGLTIALKAQGVLLAALALAILALLVARRRDPSLAAMPFALPLVLGGAGTWLAFSIWRASRRGALLRLIGGAALLSLTLALSGSAWPPSRYADGDFAREVAKRTPADQPVLFVAGNYQVLLNYAGRPVRRIDARGLRELICDGHTPLFVDLASRLRGDGARGSVLFTERVAPGEDPMVLVEAAPLRAGGRRFDAALNPR